MKADYGNFKDKLKYLSESSRKRVLSALDFAENAHTGQNRVSGEKYISHPLAVATILADINQDAETIIAGLLHDVVEDSGISQEEIKKLFGQEVEFLVESVTKISGLSFKNLEDAQAENIRKMLLSMAKDFRVIMIKIADRLHNMRTLEYLPADKQKRIARETLEIYTPLAHRLGIGVVKWELEDLCLRYLEPEIFQDIKEKVSLKRKDREEYTQTFVKELQEVLWSARLKVEISGRAKHFYSIYRKMVTQNLSFNEIYDLVAVRVLTNNEKDCYSALGMIHSRWKPIQGKIKDYIAMPKSNMYQSLHTTVIGPQGNPIEIQIRTREMHEICEFGVAAHWLYKTIDKSKQGKQKLNDKEKEYLDKLSWLRRLMEMQATTDQNAKEFLRDTKTDFLSDEIFIFSPAGDVYPLPQGATPVDFAFTVHTAVGYTCIGAKVNGKIMPLSTELKNGDIVEILRGKEQNPKEDWLLFVKTGHTKNKIKNFLNKLQKEEKIKQGQDKLHKELKANGISKAVFSEFLPLALQHYATTEEELYYGIGKGDISTKALADLIEQSLEEEKHQPLSEDIHKARPESDYKRSNDMGIQLDGDSSNILFSIAKCCHPIHGDQIIGVISRSRGISIHRKDCPNIRNLKERKIEVSWDEKKTNHKFLARIVIIGYDRVGWFKDVLDLIAEKKVNVSEAFATHNGTVTKARLALEVENTAQINELMNKIRQMKDIYEVYRG